MLAKDSQWNLNCAALLAMLKHLYLSVLSGLVLSGQEISIDRLDLKNARAELSRYRGSASIKLEIHGQDAGDGRAVIKGSHFHNGTIDVDVAGAPAKGAGDFARGFIGVDFRIQADGARGENVYIRPTNGRAADQLRRNHSTQYTSYPDWPWERLRKETPGVYESYADMVAGEWTHLRIVVKGLDASLYVGGAEQPCLLVHDLKLKDVEGAVGLWIGPGTEGYFRGVKISEK
jgi:hypothetical protein